MAVKNWRGAGTLGTAWFAGISYENDISRTTALRDRSGHIHTKVEKIGSVTDVLDSSQMQVTNMAMGLGMHGALLRSLLRDFFAIAMPLVMPVWALSFWAEFLVRMATYVALLLLFRLIAPARDRYHGAEHKVINCDIEGLDLTIDNARTQTPISDYCGTIMAAWTMPLSFLAVSLVSTPWWWLNCAIAVAAYLAIDWCIEKFWMRYVHTARENRGLLARIFVRWGTAVQRLYLTEPGDEELEVALAAYKLSIGQQVKIRIGNTTAIIHPGAARGRRRKK